MNNNVSSSDTTDKEGNNYNPEEMQSKEMQGFGKPTDVGQYKAQLTGYSPHQDCSVQYARYWTLYLFICVYHTLYGAERLPPVL